MTPAELEKERPPGRIMGRGPLGFSRKTWPFIKVLVGNWLFSLIYYVSAKQFFITWQPVGWTVADRLELMIKCSILALSPALVGIAIVAAQRLNPDMWVGQRPKPNSALDVNTRFVLNTVEQFILFIVGLSGVALFTPILEADSIPILTSLFLFGRVLFWVGYHYNPLLRAFGFGLTFYPTVGVFTWLILLMVFGIRLPI